METSHTTEHQKASELISKALYIGIAIPPMPTYDILIAAETIAETLSLLNKTVGFLKFTAIVPPHRAFTHLQAALPLLKEFIIAINTLHAPVRELRYERNDQEIAIILSPQSLPLRQDFITFREGKTQCDLIIALGLTELDQLATSTNTDANFFQKQPLINIDINNENEPYGSVNIIDASVQSMSILAYELLMSIGDDAIHPPTATKLLSGIMERTDNFQDSLINAAVMEVVASLLHTGADYKEAMSLAAPTIPLPHFQLFGRASVRSKFDQIQQCLWSFLTPEDFERTGCEMNDAFGIVKHLRRTFFYKHGVVLLTHASINAPVVAIYSGEEMQRQKLLHAQYGTLTDGVFCFAAKFSSFKEAETAIAALIAQTL